VKLGVPESSIATISRGESEATGVDAAGMAEDRGVEIQLANNRFKQKLR
jgi:hypothetical protein